jgi:pantoate--beta-alanine ligase
MGALHAGHRSLVDRARAECATVAVTIFVNPLQFAPGEDFDRYPKQLAQDLALLEQAGVDLVFTPSVAQMYPNPPYPDASTTMVDVGDVGERLDGAHRPGHFRGVATVVAKLFHIVQPGRAYFGQKDAVQIAVLRRMVRDLNFDLELIPCPIVRDPDGLALSSRNAYLTPSDRAVALALPRTLTAMRRALREGRTDAADLLALGRAQLATEPGLRVEYLEAVEPDTLLPVTQVVPGTLVAVAAKVGSTRLIDNFLAS